MRQISTIKTVSCTKQKKMAETMEVKTPDTFHLSLKRQNKSGKKTKREKGKEE